MPTALAKFEINGSLAFSIEQKNAIMQKNMTFFWGKQMLAYWENLSPTEEYWAMQKKLAACSVSNKNVQIALYPYEVA